MKLLLFLVCITLSLVSCSQNSKSLSDSTEAAKEAIRQADHAWVEAQEKYGLDGTMSFYLEGAYLLPPNSPMAIGKKEIRKTSKEMGIGSPGFSAKWRPIKIEVARSGELAYAIGTFDAMGIDSSGNPVKFSGKYVEIWKKQDNGEWKVAVDAPSFNSLPE